MRTRCDGGIWRNAPAARHVQVCSAASSALEALLAHAEPGQCLPLLQREMQAAEQPDSADVAHGLQVGLLCAMSCGQDACSNPTLRGNPASGSGSYIARTFHNVFRLADYCMRNCYGRLQIYVCASPMLQATVKGVRLVLSRASDDDVAAALGEGSLLQSLFVAFGHAVADVRKAVTFCLVDLRLVGHVLLGASDSFGVCLHSVRHISLVNCPTQEASELANFSCSRHCFMVSQRFGEEALRPYLTPLSPSQAKLIAIYVQRARVWC